uniref:C-type lectin domain-containing protein n=1 Tax=Lates calcarifer TaxID=8187 RepID=A0A4W6FVA5_LATCA
MKMALLQTSYNNLTNERDQLQVKENNLLIYCEWNIKALSVFLSTQQGWVYFGGSVYYISSVKKTWQESRNYCLQEGADLMIINSEEEQVNQWKDNIWIGLTDRETEGTWKWVDGTPLTTSYWASNEPNGHTILRDEDCGEVMLHEIKDNWNDKACDDPNFWICEKKLPL